MYEYQAFDPTLYLEHYGVKGMKWGVRKQRISNYLSGRKKRRAALRQPNAAYGKMDRTKDTILYGSKGSARINRRMNKGQTHAQASRREFALQVGVGIGSASAAMFMANYGDQLAAGIANGYARNRGARAAAKSMLKIGAGSVVNLKKSQYKVM